MKASRNTKDRRLLRAWKCAAKVRYESAERANTEAIRYKQRAYRCSVCSAWHLASGTEAGRCSAATT